MRLLLQCGLSLACLVTVFVYSMVNYMVPPMIGAAPNCSWTGSAKSLVVMTNLVSQYPLLPFIFVGTVIIVYTLLHFSKKALGEENTTRVFALITILVLILLVLWAKEGTESMQNQMVACMGLGKPNP